jgi:sugar phosphate isomerase/epimerase
MPELALQLYSVREALASDFEGTLRRVAAIGYRAVETAGLYGGTPERTARLFESLGLRAIAAHVGLPLGAQKSAVLELLEALKINTLVCPWQPPEFFRSADGLQRVCDLLNAAHSELQAHGLRLAYHNHHFECLPLPDGSLPLLRLAQGTAPEILFELDTYWAHVAGASVPELLSQLEGRAALLHLKDGDGSLEAPMVALGEGVMDFPAILGQSRAQAWIVELDRCDGDMLAAVARSFAYLQGFV